MSDFRDPNDPLRRDEVYDPNVRSSNAAWGWVAGIVFLGIIVALAFGVGRSPNHGGTNVANNTPPAASQPAPGPGNRSFTPAPINPAPAAPANPAPAPAKP
jgi:hypothetical protein